MADQIVPITGNILLSKVCEVVYQDLTGTNGRHLFGANGIFASAAGTFNPTYVGSKDRLSNFRGYQNTFINGGFNFQTEFIIFTFNFSSPGTDLDLRVRMTSPVVGEYLGWCKNANWPSTGTPIMRWGGDNTGTGKETIVMDIAAFKTAYPSTTSFTIDLRCFWFGVVTTVPVTVTAILYKGGTVVMPIGSPYAITINGYTESKGLLSTSKQIDFKSNNCASEGTRVATFTYNVNTYSGSIDASTDITSPTVPTLAYNNLTATSVNLTWSGSTDAVGVTGYRVFKNNVELITVGNINACTDSGLTTNTTYNYTVQAFDAAGNISAISNTITVVPSAVSVPGPVTGLYQTGQTISRINFAWTAVSGATAYNIYLDGVFNKSVTSTTSGILGLYESTEYEIQVSATNASGEGPLGSIVYMTTSDPIISCLVSGTLITLPTGNQVLIEELLINQLLLSSKIETLEDTNDVQELYKWSNNELIETRVESGIVKIKPVIVNETLIINGGLLEATKEHSQLIQRDGIWKFIPLGDIQVDDKLYDINKNIVNVDSVEINTEERIVYKMTLSDVSHTYFANGILTHNIKLAQ